MPRRFARQFACSPNYNCAASFQRPRRSVLSSGLWDLADGLVWGKTAVDTFAGSTFYENAAESRFLRRWLTAKRAPAHHESAQPGDDAIGGAKVGSPLATPIQNQDLMSHQDRVGNDGPKATGASKPDDGHHRMQKKSENLAHARDGIKSKKLQNSMGLANSPTTSIVCVSLSYRRT